MVDGTKRSNDPTPSLLFAEQATAPATPASGQARLYRADDGSWYDVNDAGDVAVIGGGSVDPITWNTASTVTDGPAAGDSTGSSYSYASGVFSFSKHLYVTSVTLYAFVSGRSYTLWIDGAAVVSATPGPGDVTASGWSVTLPTPVLLTASPHLIKFGTTDGLNTSGFRMYGTTYGGQIISANPIFKLISEGGASGSTYLPAVRLTGYAGVWSSDFLNDPIP